jgi:hypothetical protein
MILPEKLVASEELTSGMLAAGEDALSGFWVELTTSECALALFPSVVAAIYLAMDDAKEGKSREKDRVK